MLGFYDYLNLAFYFLFVVGVGVAFSRRNRNTSDYFRSGGTLPWWMTGASAWMASFSAWSFTGAAGKMYTSGPYVFGLYYSAVVPLLLLLLFVSHRFRRMRVVTPLEAVQLRYGASAQQFFVWLRLPFMLLLGGVALNALGVFAATLFGVPLPAVIVVAGMAMTLLSLLGGAFGVAAGDFVQLLLVVVVTGAVAACALACPDIGGWSGLWRQAPPAHHDTSAIARTGLIVAWFLALTVTKLFESSSIDASAKFLMARNERQARLSVVIPLAGTLLGPLLWLVPPTVAAIRHPDMAALFPTLKFPAEAAFLVTAREVLPSGMLGLLVCAIFAATLTTLYASVNQLAGIFVRNCYLPVLRPDADERHLLAVSKVVSGTLGGLVIALGLLVNRMCRLNLFDLLNQLAASLAVPMAIPLAYGLFVKRTPAWSSWSTVLIGLGCSVAVRLLFHPEMLDGRFGLRGPFLPEEVTQLNLIVTVTAVTTVSTAWYFFTALFYRRSTPAYQAAVETFFDRLRTPLDERLPDTRHDGPDVALLVGRLCLIYGAFVALFALFPNPAAGRLCFLACGTALGGVGGLLITRLRAHRNTDARHVPLSPTDLPLRGEKNVRSHL